MYQQIVLIGNVGNDPEQRYTPNGVAVTAFSLAVNRSWTGQDGQKQDKTTWFRVTCWRKLAEVVGQYVTKGQQIMIVGEMEAARAYQRNDGEYAASLEVTASTVKFLGSRNDAQQQNGQQPQQATQPSDKEDIPF